MRAADRMRPPKGASAVIVRATNATPVFSADNPLLKTPDSWRASQRMAWPRLPRFPSARPKAQETVKTCANLHRIRFYAIAEAKPELMQSLEFVAPGAVHRI